MKNIKNLKAKINIWLVKRLIGEKPVLMINEISEDKFQIQLINNAGRFPYGKWEAEKSGKSMYEIKKF